MRVQSRPSLKGRGLGLVLAIDGVTIEERCRWLRKKRSIVGVCWEHSVGIGLQVKGPEMIRRIADALDPGQQRCHYRKDGTVVAVTLYGQTDHYSAVPIVASASCKSETGEDLSQWLSTVLQTWEKHKYGGWTHGPIWAIGTDGDSAYCAAKHALCTVGTINPTTTLGVMLYQLSRMNREVGTGTVIATCDPKHVMKRQYLFNCTNA